jgi:acyl-coenzyme A thioesterase PaaI-like protein
MARAGANDGDQRPSRHILRELGFVLTRSGDELHGQADVVPEMWVPQTTSLRTSILAAWTDTVAGNLAVGLLAPRVPTTLELDVHAYQPLRGDGTIHAVSRTIKDGRSVVVFGVDFTDQDGEPVAVATASFMAIPDPDVTMPPEIARLVPVSAGDGRLRVPFAQRAGCERRAPGVAVLPRSDDGLNTAGTINGGLVALAVEEAALSVTPGTTLASMALRYLRPMRVGPAVASARVRAGLGRVDVRDEGSDDRLAVIATTRTFGS